MIQRQHCYKRLRGSSSSSSASIDLYFLAIGRSFGFTTSLFSFVFDFVDFLDSSVKLICYLCGTVVPQLPILHLYADWPEAESEVFQEV